MTSREFCYWLQGFFELEGPAEIDYDTLQIIKSHLAMVFKHEIDPSYPNGQLLQEIHGGTGNSHPFKDDVLLRC